MERKAFITWTLVIALSIWISNFYGFQYSLAVVGLWFLVAAVIPLKKPKTSEAPRKEYPEPLTHAEPYNKKLYPPKDKR